MVWFEFLKAQGLFQPSLNPEPEPTENGFRVMYWQSLGYLEKLADEIQHRRQTEAIPEILKVIEDVSKNPKDNYNTWYSFLMILSKLPNEEIPISVLGYLPVWFQSRFDTMSQSSAVCENLLPKFLSDTSTSEDIAKAELILQYLFSIRKKTDYREIEWNADGDSYQSLFHSYNLREAIQKEELRTNIIKHCSTDCLWLLARSLKMVLFDFPKGIVQPLQSDNTAYEMRTRIEGENLHLMWRPKESNDKEKELGRIDNYELLTEEELIQALENLLTGLPEVPTADSQAFYVERMVFSLTTDYFSAFAHDPIHSLDEDDSSEKLIEVYALIFRELLLELSRQKPIECGKFLKQLYKTKSFNYPFFKRTILFVIGRSYGHNKSLFWQMVREWEVELFSQEFYYTDLRYFFENNSLQFSDEELTSLETIINKGVQGDRSEYKESYHDYWRLNWYSALKVTDLFKSLYESNSAKQNLTSDYFKNRNQIQVRVGHITPFTPDEILQKEVRDIVTNILSFTPGDRWEGPSVEGYADSLGKAVEADPQKFAADAPLFVSVPLPYIDALLYALTTAWRNKKGFDWKGPLDLCEAFLERMAALNEQEAVDVYRITPHIIAGTIGWFLSEGLRDDAHAFDLSQLPQAKKILLATVPFLQQDNRPHDSGMDYVTHSLNTTSGKIVRAFLDYALREARNNEPSDEQKWEEQIKNVFEMALQSGIVETYTILGMYYEQFYYLHQSWLIGKVQALTEIKEEGWLAFVNGLGFARAPFTEDLYHLFYPHYKKAIDSESGLNDRHDRGLLLHLIAFYFRGYENLSPKSLSGTLLTTADSATVNTYCTRLWQQEKYLGRVSEKEQEALRKKVFAVWETILKRFSEPQTKAEDELLEHLLDLTGYINQLNEQTTELLRTNLIYLKKGRYFHSLIEDLLRIIKNGSPFDTAQNLATILERVTLSIYCSEEDKKKFIELIEFLYSHDQRTTANKICNQASIQGHQFLNALYQHHNKLGNHST